MGEDTNPSPQLKTGAKPRWDQEEADRLVGKYVLVGITSIAPDGTTVTSQTQYHGKVSRAAPSGFTIECEGARVGQTMVLPPDIQAFRIADKGEYRLHSTGEVVTDPDVLATWSVYETAKGT